MEKLNLFFPQWQGAGNTLSLYEGALQLFERFDLHKNFETVPVDIQPLDVDVDACLHKIVGYDPIAEQLKNASEIIERHRPDRIFSVGGGCDIELPPVSYLNRKYKGDMSVVWFDAHGDLNTPDSSPSGLFHGMPLRALLGDAPAEVSQALYSKLHPRQIILAGARELDPPEIDYISQNKIKCLSPNAVVQLQDVPLATNLYIHIDLDVLDPGFFPNVMCPTPGGLSFEMLMTLLDKMGNSRNIVGLSLLEYTANKEIADLHTQLKEIIDFGIAI